MQRQPVESTNVRSVGYDPATRTLEVEFRSAGVYQYSDVDEETFNQFMASSSKGKFLNKSIKGKFLSIRPTHTGRRA